MRARKTIRKRIMIVTIATTLCGIAVFVLLIGLKRLQTVKYRNEELHLIHTQILSNLAEMQREVLFLKRKGGESSEERLLELLEECNEALSALKDGFGELLVGWIDFKQLEEEWSELSSDVGDGWDRYEIDLMAFKNHFDDVRDRLQMRLALARQTALLFCSTGVVTTGLAFLLCLWILLTLLSDKASDRYNPDALEEEVQLLATSYQFKTRINLLFPAENRDGTRDDWKLRLTRRFPAGRTHICFEVQAYRNGKQIELWGRRYKWAGNIKSFQRLFFPAFHEATWRALCLMYNNGLRSPVPIAFDVVRTGPFISGAIMLVEHIGSVSSIKAFLKSGFALLSENEQNEYLQRLIAFLHSLHDLGIYGIRPRYLYEQKTANFAQIHFYLFDLDKILLWTSCPSFADNILRRRDYHSLMRYIEPVLSRARLLKLQEYLQSRCKVSIQKS